MKTKLIYAVVVFVTFNCSLLTFNCVAQTAYITNTGDITVSVINIATNNVMATIPVGSGPFGVSVSPDGSKVYVANFDGTVSVINTATNNVSATITVGTNPEGISVSPDGTKVYVANAGTNTVSVINITTNTVSATIPVGIGPTAFGNFISSYTTGFASLIIEPENINLYPNPTSDKITISNNETSKETHVSIIDIQGKLIMDNKFRNQNLLEFDVSGIAKGIYLVKVQTDNCVETKKLVIQ